MSKYLSVCIHWVIPWVSREIIGEGDIVHAFAECCNFCRNVLLTFQFFRNGWEPCFLNLSCFTHIAHLSSFVLREFVHGSSWLYWRQLLQVDLVALFVPQVNVGYSLFPLVNVAGFIMFPERINIKPSLPLCATDCAFHTHSHNYMESLELISW